jgi:hypothetical protein
MDKKKCSRCGDVKLLKDFSFNKATKSGFMCSCKECDKLKAKIYRKTKKGLVYSIYSNQTLHSKQKGKSKPSYSLNELRTWLFSQELFHKLYDNWVESGYDRMLIPSIDRKNDYKSYSFDNIQLMTWKENMEKGSFDRINGINNKLSKAVIQYDLEGNFIKEYYSIMQASRDNKISDSNISSVCSGKRFKTAGGFIWKYKNEQS